MEVVKKTLRTGQLRSEQSPSPVRKKKFLRTFEKNFLIQASLSWLIMYNPNKFVLIIQQQFWAWICISNCRHISTISLYIITGSHVQRLLVHVHMYTMYYLSVVLVLCKDVIRLCSYRVKSEGSYISPHSTPPLVFPGEKIYTSYHMNFAFMVKCLSFGAL